MSPFKNSDIWIENLASKEDDIYSEERDILRVAYEKIRDRSKPLAEDISASLPDFTVHDLSHSDALWEYAELIMGDNYPLNPCEVFVLGCAFLIHDLGMGFKSYQGGIEEIKERDLWQDTVADLLRKNGASEITDKEIRDAPREIEQKAFSHVLRQLHAEEAMRLANEHWEDPFTGEHVYLIEDKSLRDSYGPIIGKIASSHWWDIEDIRQEFSATMGAQAHFPTDWIVDPLKLACILRCADYSHIDERRAPAFLRTLYRPKGVSKDHWIFQEKLYRPQLENNRLIYTAKTGFSVEEAHAWWLCFDVLNNIDSELKKTDSLLADTGRKRFNARGVSHIDNPSRIANLIETIDWKPVDTQIRASAVAELVTVLGGKELYGNIETPPLREMVQNAADAIRARRIIEDRSDDWGEIIVNSGVDDNGYWIQVEDNGIGMSEAVLTGPLLDFGTTFWGTTMMHLEHPGLAQKGFNPTGQYGIGIFSLFMWGDRIDIISQRYDSGKSETFVLSFNNGINERPILRKAKPEEYILDGGTKIKVWFREEESFERLHSPSYIDETLSLAQICAQIAPALDVSIKAKHEDEMKLVVNAYDWKSLESDELVSRLIPYKSQGRIFRYSEEDVFPPLRNVEDSSGRLYGRAAIWHWERYYSLDYRGVVTVGGLVACGLAGIIGVLEGNTNRVSRDVAIPNVPLNLLRMWARRERDARVSEGHPPPIQVSLAEVINSLGVKPEGLVIASSENGWVTPRDILDLSGELEKAYLVQAAAVSNTGGKVGKVRLNKGVFAVDMGAMTVLNIRSHLPFDKRMWPSTDENGIWGDLKFYRRTLAGVVIEYLAKGWGLELETVLKSSTLDTEEKRVVREVGSLLGKKYEEDVIIVRKPSS